MLAREFYALQINHFQNPSCSHYNVYPAYPNINKIASFVKRQTFKLSLSNQIRTRRCTSGNEIITPKNVIYSINCKI